MMVSDTLLNLQISFPSFVAPYTTLTSTFRIRWSVVRLLIRPRDRPWKGMSPGGGALHATPRRRHPHMGGGLRPPPPRRDAVSVADEWQDHAEGSRRNGSTPRVSRFVFSVPRSEATHPADTPRPAVLRYSAPARSCRVAATRPPVGRHSQGLQWQSPAHPLPGRG